jgi:hypothetical protein
MRSRGSELAGIAAIAADRLDLFKYSANPASYFPPRSRMAFSMAGRSGSPAGPIRR